MSVKLKTSLYTRFNNTRSDVKLYKSDRDKSLPIAHHFNLPYHFISDASLQGIEKNKTTSTMTSSTTENPSGYKNCKL